MSLTFRATHSDENESNELRMQYKIDEWNPNFPGRPKKENLFRPMWGIWISREGREIQMYVINLMPEPKKETARMHSRWRQRPSLLTMLCFSVFFVNVLAAHEKSPWAKQFIMSAYSLLDMVDFNLGRSYRLLILFCSFSFHPALSLPDTFFIRNQIKLLLTVESSFKM